MRTVTDGSLFIDDIHDSHIKALAAEGVAEEDIDGEYLMLSKSYAFTVSGRFLGLSTTPTPESNQHCALLP